MDAMVDLQLLGPVAVALTGLMVGLITARASNDDE